MEILYPVVFFYTAWLIESELDDLLERFFGDLFDGDLWIRFREERDTLDF